MKAVSLCEKCSSCPVVKIKKENVEIGEKGNLCILKKEEWNTLKRKIVSGEL